MLQGFGLPGVLERQQYLHTPFKAPEDQTLSQTRPKFSQGPGKGAEAFPGNKLCLKAFW